MTALARGKSKLTSHQLAALLGVSQSAVSRAFTPGSSISAKLRARVLSGAEKFGYQPNAIASMLATKRTNMVGIVVSEMRNPFYPVLIEKLTQELQGIGLQSLLFNVTPGARIEEQLAAIHIYDVDAIVVVSATILSERALAWASEGRRTILLNRQSNEELTTICVDNTAGSRAAVDHFHAIGRKRIGYVAGLTKTAIGVGRQGAFLTRLAECGLTLAGICSDEAYTYEAGWKAAIELLKYKPDAIQFASDILALGGIDALKARGIDVPGDLAVAGFDDIEMASWPHYSLTTYRQPIDELVAAVVARIADPTIDPAAFEHVTLPGKLIQRQSTAVPMPSSDQLCCKRRADQGESARTWNEG